jgi:hypothetical protein
MGANNCNFLYRKPKSEEANVKDFYQTIPQMTFALLDVLKHNFTPDTRVLDCCAGEGALSSVLRTYFKSVDEIDLFNTLNPIDFLTYYPEEKYPLIVGNTPFSAKYKFIDHALDVGQTFVTLFPGLSDCYNVTGRYKAKKEYCGRISMYPKVMLEETISGDGSFIQGGTQNYSWFMFDRTWYENAKMMFPVEIVKDLHDYDEIVKEYLDNRK